jgi:integrase
VIVNHLILSDLVTIFASMKLYKLGEWYYIRFEFKGREYRRATKCNSRPAAERVAKDIYNSIIGEHFKNPDQLKVRSNFCTIDDICKAYHEKSALLVEPDTSKKNILSFLKIISDVQNTDKPREVNASVLTRSLITSFQNKRITSAGDNYQKKESAKNSANSIIQQARSLFSKKLIAQDAYSHLKLPDLMEFLRTPLLKVQPKGYQPIEPQLIEAMNAAADELKITNAPLHLIHMLFLRMGLRNKEILHAKHSWIVPYHGSHGLAIITRNDFKPKGAPGIVPMPKDVYKLILKLKSDKHDYIIPAESATERYDLIYEDHSNWVKKFIPDRQKTSYELRKHAGSIIATREKNIMAAQAFLRHKSPTTTATYYAKLLKPLTPIEATDVSN